MTKWSDFLPDADEYVEYAPLLYSAGGASVGGLLGWLYDKFREKKHTARRIGIGALLGALGGTAYGQHVLNEDANNKISSEYWRGEQKAHDSYSAGYSSADSHAADRIHDIAEALRLHIDRRGWGARYAADDLIRAIRDRENSFFRNH